MTQAARFKTPFWARPVGGLILFLCAAVLSLWQCSPLFEWISKPLCTIRSDIGLDDCPPNFVSPAGLFWVCFELSMIVGTLFAFPALVCLFARLVARRMFQYRAQYVVSYGVGMFILAGVLAAFVLLKFEPWVYARFTSIVFDWTDNITLTWTLNSSTYVKSALSRIIGFWLPLFLALAGIMATHSALLVGEETDV